ncbi:MAG: DUF1566 domain-containing protein, partial [Spirochaetaceae bacterium]|nr:DUF1566 domain-containing protein [Spirochaetaceae bacterium]
QAEEEASEESALEELVKKEKPLPTLAVPPISAAAENNYEREDIAAMREAIESGFFDSALFKPVSSAPRIELKRGDSLLPDAEEMTSDAFLEPFRALNLNYTALSEVEISPKYYILQIHLIELGEKKIISTKKTKIARRGQEIKTAPLKLIRKLISARQFKEFYVPIEEESVLEAAGEEAAVDMGTPPPDYMPGDTGPAGGIIIFSKPRAAENWRYIEVSPVDLPGTYPWGMFQDGVGVIPNIKTKLALGDGIKNTEMLLAALPQPETDPETGEITKEVPLFAATACDNFELNGFSDWFLPSREELDLAYRIIAEKGNGNFSDTSYWTSSQSTATTAWYQRFFDGRIYYNGRKAELFLVRPFRVFK